jgi:hypothetical protein
VARARRRWMREQGMFDPTQLVFIDETSTNTATAFPVGVLLAAEWRGAAVRQVNVSALLSVV